MLLEDRTTIAALAARIFAFFDDLADNYTRWHPDHHRFEWRHGTRVEIGNVCRFDETIGGKRMKKQVVFTEVERDRLIAFAPTSRLARLLLPRLSFELVPVAGGIEFIARIWLRIGPLAAWLNRRDLDAVRRHMREEGQNLKALMERAD